MQLEGKTAIITGASSGIGEASARLFAREGARLVLSARRKDRLEDLAASIRRAGGEALAVPGDVQHEEHAAALVETALSRFGGLDIGFNNAGVVGAMSEVTAMTDADWQTTLQTNLTSAFHGARHQIPAMRERGRGSILFTSSFVGYTIGFPEMAAYGASKAGLIGLTQCLAVELGADGIRVNALLPGGTRTPMAGDFAHDPGAAERIARLHALRRMAGPEEIARAALFLASDSASFVTGTAMLVDGGNSICKASS